MKREAFDDVMRLWGYHFGPRRVERIEAGQYGACTLAGLGRPTIRQTVNMDRGGYARRRLMGAAAGLVGDDGAARLLPAWAATPVRFAATGSSGAKVLAGFDFVPQEAAQVERAVFVMGRKDAELAKVVRTQYCKLGTQKDKAIELGMTIGVYREKLAEGRGWLRCELAH